MVEYVELVGYCAIDKDSVKPLVTKLEEMEALEGEQRARLKARPSTMTTAERKTGWKELKHVTRLRKKAEEDCDRWFGSLLG